MLDDEDDVADEEDDGMVDSIRPVTSTFLPMCFARSRESPSSAYDMPVPAVAVELVPDVPVALELLGGGVVLAELGIEELLPFTASLRMNELLDAVADPDGVVLPLVPVALGMVLLLPFSRQPVSVTLSFELALLLLLV